MTELDNICWVTNNEYWAIQDRIINQLIYQPARGCNRTFNRTFYYNVLYYYYRHRVLSLKNGATLDDLKLSTKYWTWYFNSTKIPIKFLIPITFKEFLNNRSLSIYIQKASKEI